MADGLTVLLFDVDGVIVDPRAYKVGVIRSMEFLCTACGLRDVAALLPQPSEIAYMESRGIHDVWDITNIMFGLVLSKVFKSLNDQNQSFNYTAEDAIACLQEIK